MPVASAENLDPASNLSQIEGIAAYWDSLSKLYLTPGALKEFDRRNRLAGLTSGFDLIEHSAALPEFSSQIKRFAKQGGPDLSNLRGFPEPPGTAASVAHTTPLDTLGNPTVQPKETKTSPYSKNFENHLFENGIYMQTPSQRPANWNDIRRAIIQPRPSHSPSEFSDSAYEAFENAHVEAISEAMVMRNIWPILIGRSNIPSAGDILFGNLEQLTGDKKLVVPKPDFYDGVHRTQIVSRFLRELGTYIVPSAVHEQAPVLPNFFAEIKSNSGNDAVAKRQACYDGTLGARGIQKFRTFGVEGFETLYDNKAYTISATYRNGMLRLYTVHPSPSIDPEKPLYYMTRLKSTSIEDHQDLQKGANWLRNARDWARVQRDELVVAANRRVISNHAEVPREISTQESNHSLLSQTPGGPSNHGQHSQPIDESSERRNISSLHSSLWHMSARHDLLSDRLLVLESQLSSIQSSLFSNRNGRSSLRNRLSSSKCRRSSRYSPYRIPTPKRRHLSAKESTLSLATSDATSDSFVYDGIHSQSSINEVVPGPEVVPQPGVSPEQRPIGSYRPFYRSGLSSTQRQSSRNSRYSPYRRRTPRRQSSTNRGRSSSTRGIR